MPAPSHRLARALADRLGEVLPPPFTVQAEGGGLALYLDGAPTGGNHATRILDEEDGRTLAEKVETAAWADLSGIQDCVSRDLASQWPPDGRGGMALPGVRVADGIAHLWFGEREEAAALALRPIPLAELEEE